MAEAKKKNKVGKQEVLALFMDYVLAHEVYPKSVYKFCKASKLKEEELYAIYGSIEGIKKGVWKAFFENTIEVLHKNKEYEKYPNREKILSFFFTFFELLTLNRSYVLLVLQMDPMPLKNLSQLKGLRKHIKSFVSELIEINNEEKEYKIIKNPVVVLAEGTWVQFLFLLKFWMDDESAGFEKTDMAIEKSVHTIFDLFDKTSLSNVLDFGKFLWHEKIKM